MMKAGRDTGSLINHLMSRSLNAVKVPEVGDPATMLSWTDRNPGTVVDVKRSASGKTVTVTVRADDYRRTDKNGMSEMQDYIYFPNYSGATRTYTSRNGKPFKGVVFGFREKYHDYSF